MPWDPMKGQRLAPAWKAARRLVADGEWHDWQEVIDVMLKGSDLARKTCDGLLHKGIREGYLVRIGQYDQKAKRDERQVGRGWK